jgi:hypothetical protein
MYYLKHEKECFIIFKTRGAAERFKAIFHCSRFARAGAGADFENLLTRA